MRRVNKYYFYIDRCIINILYNKIMLIMAAYLILLSITGCMSTIERPDPPRIKDTEIFEANFVEVWNALVATISERRYRIDMMDKERGFLNTKTITLDTGIRGDVEIAYIAVRPSITYGTWRQIRYSYSVQVTESRYNITRVQIQTTMEAYENNITNEWHICYSRGILEERIFKSIKEKIF